MNRRFRAKLSDLQSALRSEPKISDFIPNKVSNLKMDIDDTENPFGDGVGNRGVGDDDENIPLISTSSRRGSEDTTYHRTHGETSFIEGIDEHTPLIQRENELNDSVDEIKKKFPNADTSKFVSKIDEYGRVKVRVIRTIRISEFRNNILNLRMAKQLVLTSLTMTS